MPNTVRNTSKNTFLLLLGTVCKMGMSFALVIYIARLMGLEGFGKYSLAIFYFELFLSLTSTAIGILLTREIARCPDRQRELLLHAGLLASLLTVMAAGTLIALCEICGYARDTTLAIYVSILGLLPAALGVLLESVFIALEEAEHVTIGTILEGAFRLVASFALLGSGFGLIELFWALVAARIALLIYYAWRLPRPSQLSGRFDMTSFRQFVRQWRVFAVENWLATIYTSLDIMVLSLLQGELAVGVYSAASRIVRLGTVAAKSYTTAVYPVLARTFRESKAGFDRVRSDSLRLLFAIGFLGVVVVSVLAERVVELLFSSDYVAAVPVLRILIWSLLLGFLNPFLSHVLFAANAQRQSMQVAVISLLINLVLSYGLISRWEAMGAAWSAVLSGCVALCCYCAYALDIREIWRFVALGTRTAAAAAGTGIVMFAVRDYPWLITIGAGIVVYVPLLLVLRVVTSNDFKVFMNRSSLSQATSTS